MSPEEKLISQTWVILQQIKEESLTTVGSKPVKYRIPQIVGVGLISPDRKVRILEKLEENGAFVIQRREDGVRVGASDIYFLILNQPEFKKIYQEYESLVTGTKLNTKSVDQLKKLSPKARKRVFVVISRLIDSYEISPSEGPIEFNPISYLDSDNSYDERSIIKKLEELHVLTAESNDMMGGILIFTKLEILQEAYSILDLQDENNPDDHGDLISRLALRPTPGHISERDSRDRPKLNPSEIADGFSLANIPFVLSVLGGIISSAEFSHDGEVIYSLQSSPGSDLVKERILLKKFEACGLFEYEGEDGIWGNCSLKNVDIKLLKEVMSAITHKKLGYSNDDSSQERPTPALESQVEIVPNNSKSIIYNCGSLEINVSAAQMKFGTNPAVEIQPNNREIKFLIALIQDIGKVVKYSEILKRVGSTTDGDEEAQYLKRDVKPKLKEAGMTDNQFDKMIINIKKIGYKIVPPQ